MKKFKLLFALAVIFSCFPVSVHSSQPLTDIVSSKKIFANDVFTKRSPYEQPFVLTKQTPDGGFIVYGYYKRDEEFHLFKLNASHELEWSRSYNVRMSYDLNLEILHDGYWIAGMLDRLPYVFKLDTNGNLVWEQQLSLDVFADRKRIPQKGHAYVGDIISIDQTIDQGLIALVPLSFGQYYIVKFDGNGEVKWSKKIVDEISISRGGGFSINYSTKNLHKIQQTPDGGYIVSGLVDTHVENGMGYYDAYAMKLDIQGELEWDLQTGGDRYDWFHGIYPTSDGGFLFTGGTLGNSTDVGFTNLDDLLLVKVDRDGNVQFERNYFGKFFNTSGSLFRETADGYLIIGADTTVWHGASKAFILNIDHAGELIWVKRFDRFRSFSNSQEFGLPGENRVMAIQDNEYHLIELSHLPPKLKSPAKTFVNGKSVELGQSPVVDKGLVFVPVRAIMEQLGAIVLWDQGVVRIVMDNLEATLWIEQHTGQLKIGEQTLDIPVHIYDHTTFIPLHALAEAFGLDAYYHEEYNVIHILSQDHMVEEPLHHDYNVQILGVDKTAEAIAIHNYGSENLHMKGWKVVSTHGGETFTFPDYTLEAGEVVIIFSGDYERNYSGSLYSLFPSIMMWHDPDLSIKAKQKWDHYWENYWDYERDYIDDLINFELQSTDIWDEQSDDFAELYDDEGNKVSDWRF